MTITLPDELESTIQAAVRSGRFASFDDAMAEAARLLICALEEGQSRVEDDSNPPGPGSIGFMRDAADELDEIVADAYRNRREETWRDISVE